MEFQIKLTDRLCNFSEFVEVKQIQDGITIGEYKMALSDIINALQTSATEGVKQETPLLPRNCLKLITNSDGYEVFIELPKRQWQVEYEEKKFMLGFPRLVLKYYIVRGNIQNLKMFAVKNNSVINGNTEMYYFPYSNVEHRTGNVCMGMNVFPNIKEIAQLEKMHLLFFSAPFGNDYGSRAIGHDLKGLFKSFQGKPFNDEILMPMNKTLNECFQIKEIVDNNLGGI